MLGVNKYTCYHTKGEENVLTYFQTRHKTVVPTALRLFGSTQLPLLFVCDFIRLTPAAVAKGQNGNFSLQPNNLISTNGFRFYQDGDT